MTDDTRFPVLATIPVSGQPAEFTDWQRLTTAVCIATSQTTATLTITLVVSNTFPVLLTHANHLVALRAS